MRDARVGQGWLVAAGLSLAVAACSGGTSSNSPAKGGQANTSGGASGSASGAPAAGGMSGVGGANGGGGNPGTAGNSATMTKYGACVAYLNAQCNRRYYECSGLEAKADPCPEYVAWCPDFLFSEGSQLDVAGVLACAEAWRKHPCELFNKGFDPECGLPKGARALGEPCFYSRQCDSGACGKGKNDALPECGSCVPIGKQGDPCFDGTFQCPNGYECTGEGCQPQITFGLPDGSLCERYGQCYGDSLCFPAADGMMRCQPRRKGGESCANGAYCAKGLGCGADSLCAMPVLAVLGELCGDRGCVTGAWCKDVNVNPTGATCVPTAAAGEPCATLPDVIDPTGNCQNDLYCYCVGKGCVKKCVTLKDEGETCGDASSSCQAGATCQAGKCVGGDLQGLAKAACGE
jgi:hypothetical protein